MSNKKALIRRPESGEGANVLKCTIIIGRMLAHLFKLKDQGCCRTSPIVVSLALSLGIRDRTSF